MRVAKVKRWIRAVHRGHIVQPLALLLGFAGVCPAELIFTDATEQAGVSYLQHHPNPLGDCWLANGAGCEPERMTGGAAVGDVDADGWDDLLVTRMDAPLLLFRNLGNGTFTDVAAAAGLQEATRTNGAAFADVDNDGDLDLFLTTVAGNRAYLYINDGAGHFTEEAAARGALAPSTPVNVNKYTAYSVNVGDYDNDGWVDVRYSFWRVGESRLLRNRGRIAPGYFVDVTAAAGIDTKMLEFSATFTDLDRDGWLDLALAGDFRTSRLYWNNGDGTFVNGTAAAGVGTDENGMGSTLGDFDGDGDLDWFVTSIYDPDETCETGQCNWGYTGNRLYRNGGDRHFTSATNAAGVRDGYWGWGAVFFDADNDADLDLVMTNGANFPGSLDRLTRFTSDPMRFWENAGGGQMTEVSTNAGVLDNRSGKGLLTFDYDQDGDLDLFVVNNGDAPILYRNDSSNLGDWLRIRFTGSAQAYEGLNAFITVTAAEGGPAQVREMGVSSHFLGQSERVAHFGLGPASPTPVYEVRVEWQCGEVETYGNLARNQVLVLTAPDLETKRGGSVTHHTADTNANNKVSLSELLRVIQLYNAGVYHREDATEDGYAPGAGLQAGFAHLADYNPVDWVIDLSELLRTIQFYNAGGYVRDFAGEDGFAPV